MKIGRFIAIGVSSWLCLNVSSLIAADEILFEETFNDDGEGTRYTSEGRLVSELEDHAANGVQADQVGPVYWGHSSEVSLVGVPGPTAERRVVITWHHELEPDQVTDEGRAMVEAAIAWLTRDKANIRVFFSPAPAGAGDEMLVDMIEANGGTVSGDDDTAGPLPPAADFDLVIHSSQGAVPSRFTNFPVPYLTYNGPDHDDELVGTIGLSLTQAFPDINVSAPEHPAAGGLTGAVEFFVGDVTVDAPGTGVPDGSTVVASYPIVDIPPITSLADVEAMVAGEVETVVDEGTIPAADLEGGDAGNFSGAGGDNPAPGGPIGSFATVATGSLTVKEPGTYGFALWVAGGARLRIDVDGNGLDASDTVITQDTPNMVDGLVQGTTTYGDATFDAAGDYDFEWVAYSPTDIFGAEVYFTFVAGAGQRDPIDDQEKWAPLADWEAGGIDVLPINLNGEIAVTKYEQPSQVIEERPLIVAINGPDEGGQVFGGGAFIDFEGEGFFAGSGLDKFLPEISPKTLTLNPIDVTGETGLKLKVLLAATTLDFETSDLLDIKIDPNNSGTFEDLVHFTAPSGNDKFFSDGMTDLNIAFQEVTYDLPDGMTDLVIRIEALTTWWNEVVAFDHIRVVKEVEAEFTELWVLGDPTNGNQTEFSQEQGMDEAPGSATSQDDDFYFHGIYPDPIGTVVESEPFVNFDRAHVPGDPFNRIHFNLDADSAAADTELRMTFALCCFGAAEGLPTEHDMVFRLNGKEVFSDEGINSDRIIEETVTAGDFDVVEGANTIEIERTGGTDGSAWVQYDFVRLEASAGAPVPAPDDGGGGAPQDEPGTLPADSVADFGGPGVDNGWTYGYRNVDLDDRTEDYDPVADFIQFPEDWWTGTQWDEPNVDEDNVPWTQLGPENTHPNGDNNGELHWTIRRWTSPGGSTEITWSIAKENVDCGNGVTGAVHVNGARVDSATIASDDAAGVTQSITVDLEEGDVVDLIHSPFGTDETDNDGCDGSLMSMSIKAATGDPGELPEGAFPLDATATGDGLTGYYWNLPPETMLTEFEPLHKAGDGPEGADNSNSGWTDENVYNALPNSGQFVATTFNYGGNDLTPITEWLGDDAGSFSGTEGILGDAAFRFVGYVRVAEPGERTFTTTSDDGSVVYVNDQLVVSNDNSHGNETASGSFDFPAAGYYPVDIRYYNGDWTDDDGNHGGANFIGDAGFTDVVQGLEGVEPFYTPPTDGGGGGPGDGERPFILQEVGVNAAGAFSATLPAGVTGDIEYSIDLIDWEIIATGVTGTVEETDPDRLAAAEGYYRATVP